MKEEDWEKILKKEDFTSIYTWFDEANKHYSDHKHPFITAHIILDGEMVITVKDKSKVYRKGDRFDVPADTIHSAKMGKNGCRYMIGEK